MNGRFRLDPLHMYCKTLIYTDKFGVLSGVVEDMPDGGLMLWEKDFECNQVRKDALFQTVKQELFSVGRELHIVWGEPRIATASR